MWFWALGIGVFCVVAISAVQYRAGRGTYKSLASRQPARRQKTDVPLGLEAIDMDHVTRTTRRNETLERAHVNWNRGAKGSLTQTSEIDIEPGPDDHSYAGWFHKSFMKNKDKT